MIVTGTQLKEAWEAENQCRYLRHFVPAMWQVLEPGIELKWNWHHDLICDEVQMLMTREDPNTGEQTTHRELVICEPPRFLKSIVANVCAPLWLWLHQPWFKVQALSNDASLGRELSEKSMAILMDPSYQRLVVHMASTRVGYEGWGIAKSQRALVNFANTSRGRRQTLSRGGILTGKGAMGQIIDDPYDVKETAGAPDRVTERMKYVVWLYDNAWRSRLDDALNSWRLLIMQRVHPKDLAQELISRGVRSLVLPNRYDPEMPIELGGVHPRDPRTVRGQLLHPERFPQSEVEDILLTPSGQRFFLTQHDQRPTTPGGTLFKEVYCKRHDPDVVRLNRRAHRWALSVDSNFKKSGASRCAIGLWARYETKYKLQRGIALHMDYPELRRLVLQLWRAHQGDIEVVLIEAAANGHALIADLQTVIPCIKAIVPRESKFARAQRCSAIWEAGNVSVAEGPEGDEFVGEVVGFPEGAYDDQLDQMTQLLNHWESSMVEVGFTDLHGNESELSEGSWS